MAGPGRNVALLVTCLVDSWRPSVGFAAVKLLEESGCHVSVPAGQTCCGQPAYNTGDRADARMIARQVIDEFESFDYIVVGDCSTLDGLAAPYDEENTPHVLKIERVNDGRSFVAFWFSNGNTDLFSGKTPEMQEFTP